MNFALKINETKTPTGKEGNKMKISCSNSNLLALAASLLLILILPDKIYAYSYTFSDSGAYNDTVYDSGPFSSSAFYNTGNYARSFVDLASGTFGAEVRAFPHTVGPPIVDSWTSISMYDTYWCGPPWSGCVPPPLAALPVEVSINVSGTWSDESSTGNNQLLRFTYDVGSSILGLEIRENSVNAWIDDVSGINNIALPSLTLANGVYSLSENFVLTDYVPVWWGISPTGTETIYFQDLVNLHAEVVDVGGDSLSTFIDFYNTFQITPRINDPAYQFYSELGRPITSAATPVPEPSTFLLLGSGLAVVATLRVFRKR